MTHKEAVEIVLSFCNIDETGINCGSCCHFGNCPIFAKYGKREGCEIISSFTNPLNRMNA